MNKISFSKPLIDTKSSLRNLQVVINKKFPNEGEFTKKFENRSKKILNSKYALATTSGTIAIYLALKALNVGHKDEVIVPNITFQATVNAIKMSGAKPILVDINPENLLIDLKSLESSISNKTKVVIPVHVSGRGNNILEIVKICKKYKIKIIEDAAEAFGSKIKKKCLGNYGICGCFSFAPNKIITTGQGGLVITNNKKIYFKLKALKNQGRIGQSSGGEDYFVSWGINSRLTDLQAAVGLSQLKTFAARKKKLLRNYRFYLKELVQNKNFKIFNFKSGEIPLWTDVYSSKRNQLIKFLKRNKIQCRPYWLPINTTIPYKNPKKKFPNSSKLFKKLMWLPSSLDLTLEELKKVCKKINKFNSKVL